MPREAIVLANGTRFETQEAGRKHFRLLRDEQTLGKPIADASHHSDLLALYQRYTELVLTPKDRRAISDVSHFTTTINTGKGRKPTRGFRVYFKDGQSSDFSFPHAIRGKGKSVFDDFRDACRRAVDADIQLFKESYFIANEDPFGFVPSQLSGESIPRRHAHVDHEGQTFHEIAKAFMLSKGWSDVPAGVISEQAENQTTTIFVDQKIREEFRQFHNATAKLRVISEKENLTLAGKANRGRKRKDV